MITLIFCCGSVSLSSVQASLTSLLTEWIAFWHWKGFFFFSLTNCVIVIALRCIVKVTWQSFHLHTFRDSCWTLWLPTVWFFFFFWLFITEPRAKRAKTSGNDSRLQDLKEHLTAAKEMKKAELKLREEELALRKEEL